MPRRPRVVLPGFPHHITNRGNRMLDIYHDDDDRRSHLRLIRKYSIRHAVEIWSYRLMSNHFHLIVRPDSEAGLPGLLHDGDGKYAEHFNDKYQLTGHLWQARFFSCVMDTTHLWSAVRYVEQNPVQRVWSGVPRSTAGPVRGADADSGPTRSFLRVWSFHPSALCRTGAGG